MQALTAVRGMTVATHTLTIVGHTTYESTFAHKDKTNESTDVGNDYSHWSDTHTHIKFAHLEEKKFQLCKYHK